jgi:hypothetical protein
MKLGSKKISFNTKKTLLRSKPRVLKSKPSLNSCQEYFPLIQSFKQTDFVEYELLCKKFGPGQKRIKMLEYLDKKGIIDGPCRELAEIRNKDLYLHQKLIQQLRYIWYNIDGYRKDIVNNNPDLFWDRMTTHLLRATKERNIYLSEKWQGPEGKAELKKFLINLYNKQEGKCAISGEPLLLQHGKNRPLPGKCSLDRINSENGYTRQNVWFVAWWVNQMKMDMPMDVFKARIKLLSEVFNKNLTVN